MFTCNMYSIDCNCVSNNPYKNNIDMKTNEAPEKIYIDANEDWHRTYTAFTTKAKGDDIEYTRTDAFIDKAVEWLRCHPSSYYDDLEEFSNAFRKAMKVE